MHSKVRWWLTAVVVLAGLCCASAAAADEGETRTFNSRLPMTVYAVVDGKDTYVGMTPSDQPLTIPPCERWYVAPEPPVDMPALAQEVKAQRILGLKLWEATEASLEQLKGLTALRMLDLSDTQVTDAGLELLEELAALQIIYLRNTQVTDAGIEHLRRSLPSVAVSQ